MNGDSTTVDYQEIRTDQPVRPQEAEKSAGPLFPGGECESFRSQWQNIQADFVDEPRRAVEAADQLVSKVIARLSEIFAGERERMEREWPKEGDVSTEDLRQALRKYRAFLDRLMAV